MVRLFRFCTILAGLFFVGLGWVGAFVPGLPTVPFLILALACFARSSDRFYNWLYNHKFFGPPLVKWKEYGVISRKTKIIAITSMLLSLLYMIFIVKMSWLPIVISMLFMLVGAGYILSKPSYPEEKIIKKIKN